VEKNILWQTFTLLLKYVHPIVGLTNVFLRYVFPVLNCLILFSVVNYRDLFVLVESMTIFYLSGHFLNIQKCTQVGVSTY
jgi:hypothetical protein